MRPLSDGLRTIALTALAGTLVLACGRYKKDVQRLCDHGTYAEKDGVLLHPGDLDSSEGRALNARVNRAPTAEQGPILRKEASAAGIATCRFADVCDEVARDEARPPVVRGAELFQKYSCVSCHTTDGQTLVGASLKGVYGSEIELADGRRVKMDGAALKAAILDPRGWARKGFQFDFTDHPRVADSDADALVAYIETLH